MMFDVALYMPAAVPSESAYDYLRQMIYVWWVFEWEAAHGFGAPGPVAFFQVQAREMRAPLGYEYFQLWTLVAVGRLRRSTELVLTLN